LKELTQIPQNLPYSPALLQKLFAQTSRGSLASLTQISETMAQDQGLTTKILTMANSAFYGLQSKVTTVSRAMVVLGLKEVRTMVLLIGIKALTKGLTDTELFNLREYWRHQLITAAAAGLIAARAGLTPEDMFTAGLLHDLGKLLTALHRPEDWRAVALIAAAENIPQAQAEEQYWGLEHGLVGSLVLSSWNLPLELTEPINWHHAPNRAPDFKPQAKVLCLANALAHGLTGDDRPIAGPWQKILKELELEEDEIKAGIQTALKDKNMAEFLSQLA